MSRPARARLIRGKTDLLSGIDIVKKLDLEVDCGIAPFKVGKSEWGDDIRREESSGIFFSPDCLFLR